MVEKRGLNKKKSINKSVNKIVLLVLVTLLFVAVIITLDSGSLGEIDIRINKAVQSLWSPSLNNIMIAITSIVNFTTMICLSAALFVFLVYKKRNRDAVITALVLGSGAILTEILKLVFQRTRPETALISVSRYSFPSSHAMSSITFFCLLIYFFKDSIKSKIGKIVFIAASIILFLAIGFSRIYLNVHWFSDVIAGFSLGALVLYFFVYLFQYFICPSNKARTNKT